MIADFAEYRANYEFSSGGLASAQRLDVKLRAAGRRPASSGAPLAAHPIMPVQVARRRANSETRQPARPAGKAKADRQFQRRVSPPFLESHSIGAGDSTIPPILQYKRRSAS